jgi:4-amino-4-deoxy-L-arabinose transferase-like glycosyltransferase
MCYSDGLTVEFLSTKSLQEQVGRAKPAFDQLELDFTKGHRSRSFPVQKLLEPLAIFLISLIIFVGSAFAPPALFDDADSAHAEVAREMVETGDPVTLRMDGIKYYEKAPLMYWMIALSFSTLAVTELAARLPIALSAVLAVMIVWALARRMFGGRAGFYSALAFATSVGTFLFTRILIPDILLTALITAALYFFISGIESESKRPYLGFYVACGLAFLTKSMIGVIFPASIVFLFLLASGRCDELKRMRIIEGATIFLLIVAPWHVLAAIRNEHFLWFHFINEQVYRYLGKRYPKDYDTVPLLVFYGLHALWIFPWTFFLPYSLAYLPRRARGLRHDQAMTLLLLIWIAVIIGFFSFSTRQEYYTLPALPALAVLSGRVLADIERATSRQLSLHNSAAIKCAEIAHWSLACMGLAALASAIAILVTVKGVKISGDISETLTKNPDYYALSLGHIFDLTPASFAALRGPVLGTGLALSLGSLLSLIFHRRKKTLASVLALAAMMIITFYWAREAMKVFDPYMSSKALAMDVLGEFKPGELIVINGEYESGSTMNFYTRQPVYMLNGRSANLWFGSYLPGAPKRFFDDSEFKSLWGGQRRVYLHTDATLAEQIRELVKPVPVYQYSQSGGKLILSNRPASDRASK